METSKSLTNAANMTKVKQLKSEETGAHTPEDLRDHLRKDVETVLQSFYSAIAFAKAAVTSKLFHPAHQIQSVSKQGENLLIDGESLPLARIETIELRHADRPNVANVFLWVAKPSSLIRDDSELREVGLVENGSNQASALAEIAKSHAIKLVQT